jgi:hypothetical protein
MTLDHKLTLLLKEVPEDDDGVIALATKLGLADPAGLFPLLLADHRPMDRRLSIVQAKHWMRDRQDEIICNLTLAVSAVAMLAAIVAAARC